MMELIAGICAGALAVAVFFLGVQNVSLMKSLREAQEQERRMARSFIRYANPGAVFVSEERRTDSDSRHTSLAQKQAEAMMDKAGEAK